MATAARFNRATFNPVLSEGLDEFDLMASQAELVGFQIAPVFEVARQTGEFTKAEIKDILKEYSTYRHDGGEYASGSNTFTKDSYSTAEHGFEVPVDDREAAIYRSYWDAEMAAANLARDVVIRNHTRRVVTAALAGTSLTAAAASYWTNRDSSDPVADVDAAKKSIKESSGFMPNAICLNWRNWMELRDSAAIRDRCVNLGMVDARVQPMLTKQMVAAALDLDYVFVSGGQRNASVEPTAPTTLTDIWTNTIALVFRYYDGPNLKTPHYMRTFHWGEDGSSIGGQYETYYSDAKRCRMFRQRMDTAEKVITPECGYKITAISAS